MKKIIVAIACGWLFMISAVAQSDDVPGIVGDGLKVYEAKNADAAYQVWKKGPFEFDRAWRVLAIGGLTQMENAYGKITGYEPVKVVKIGSSVRRVFIVLLYERGPAFAYFECYKTGEKWIITDLMFNTKANAVFPANLLEN